MNVRLTVILAALAVAIAPVCAQASIFVTQPVDQGRSTGMFPSRVVKPIGPQANVPVQAPSAPSSAADSSVYPAASMPGLNTADLNRGAGESDDAYMNRMKSIADKAAADLNRVSRESEARMRALAQPAR
ncbi:hypothetical protein [Burkholderia contaminans]|uniref:DUF4148 domain-containing protein n=1 Tax=Burkholderia contaminans TaxID=488447 RepID=A0A2S5DM34_9BURK|nr:hypothetical protein [Burkholderia contaminans]POZ80148.1 hypothetical protein C3743_39905 [Burkholderia contaminans]